MQLLEVACITPGRLQVPDSLSETFQVHLKDAGGDLIPYHLNSAGLLQQIWQLRLLGLQVRVPTNVFLGNEDVRNGALGRYLFERILDRSAIIDLIELDGVILCAKLGEQTLGGFAVRAIALAKDGDGVVFDDAFGLSFCSGHGVWAGRAREEVA